MELNELVSIDTIKQAVVSYEKVEVHNRKLLRRYTRLVSANYLSQPFYVKAWYKLTKPKALLWLLENRGVSYLYGTNTTPQFLSDLQGHIPQRIIDNTKYLEDFMGIYISFYVGLEDDVLGEETECCFYTRVALEHMKMGLPMIRVEEG